MSCGGRKLAHIGIILYQKKPAKGRFRQLIYKGCDGCLQPSYYRTSSNSLLDSFPLCSFFFKVWRSHRGTHGSLCFIIVDVSCGDRYQSAKINCRTCIDLF